MIFVELTLITSNNLIRLSRLVGHQDNFHKRIIFAEAMHIALLIFGIEHVPLAMKWVCSRELGRNLQDAVVCSERIPQDALPGVFLVSKECVAVAAVNQVPAIHDISDAMGEAIVVGGMVNPSSRMDLILTLWVKWCRPMRRLMRGNLFPSRTWARQKKLWLLVTHCQDLEMAEACVM
jgi:hypothetical protein